MRVDEPRQPEPRGADDGLIGVGGDPDRRKRLLHRTDRACRVVQLEKPALEGDRLFGPQPLDQLQRLQHARHPLLPDHAESFVLDLAIADADAEHDAAFRYDIEAGNVFGDLNRVEQRQQQYRQAEIHRTGVGGQPR